MKALVVDSEQTLRLQDIPLPTAGPFEALVKIEACGICNTTDSELIRGTQPYHRTYPAVLGHEAVGQVVATGDGVRKFRVGDRVTRPAAITPGTSRHGLASCWGGFAEYGLVRDAVAEADGKPVTDYYALRQNVVDPRLSIEQAVLAISLAETASWTWQLGQMGGLTVCVAGTGVAGLSIATWCKLAGARMVIVLGRRDSRLAMARKLAADATVNVAADSPVAAIRALAPDGVDWYCDAAGSRDQTLLFAALAKPEGRFARYAVAPPGGYDVPPQGAIAPARMLAPEAREHEAYEWVADLLLRGIVRTGDFLTHAWPLADFARAFDEIAAGRVLKGLLTMPSCRTPPSRRQP